MYLVSIYTVVKRISVAGALLASAVNTCAAEPSQEVEACLRAAAAKHGINYLLLRSIAEQESNFNPAAVGGNTNGSQDFVLMQINSTWLPTLKRYGVTQQALFNPCISADVGAWILADNFNRLGITWDTVGAYNAISPWKRVKYATGVYNKLVKYSNAGAVGNLRRSNEVAVVSQQSAAEVDDANRQMSSWEAQQ